MCIPTTLSKSFSPQIFAYTETSSRFCSLQHSHMKVLRRLSQRWHPDRWTRTPSFSGEAKAKFQQIQEAYTVLSDRRKRTMYDAGLYNPEEEEDEGISDFVDEMVSLMAEVRREGKEFSVEELQSISTEMAQEFEPSTWYFAATHFDESPCSKKIRFNTETMNHEGSCTSTAYAWSQYMLT